MPTKSAERPIWQACGYSLRPSPDLSPLGGERSPRRRSSPLPALRGERQGEGRGDWPQASHYPQYQRSGRFGRPAATLSAPHPTSPRWAGRGARGAGLPLSPPFAGRGRVRGLGDWPQASHYPQYQRSGRFGRPAASHPRPSPGLSPLTRGEGRGGASRPLDLQRLQQGPEMLRVFAPSAARGAVDGLTNLIDARG